uniref:Uncharacterized protein n=1 Tax=Solanum tuberosum TaxID=4113 RepID=M1AQR2_SOLTU
MDLSTSHKHPDLYAFLTNLGVTHLRPEMHILVDKAFPQSYLQTQEYQNPKAKI